MLHHPLPDVLILGAMRAGTTFLHRALSEHPNIAPSRVKEPQFFSHGWHGGVGAYRRNFAARAPRLVYRALGRRPRLAIDSSPYYLFHPLAPHRARRVLGGSIKAIVLLRDPAERAWSHYRLSLQRGQEHLGFLEAIAREEERLAGEDARIASGQERPDAPHQIFSYVARGRYAEQIGRWWSEFPREQFLILKSEEMFADSAATYARVCRFLGIASVTLPQNLPRNAQSSLPLPDHARPVLQDTFARPNAELHAMTGIAF